jgi:uncharacterized membrane protein
MTADTTSRNTPGRMSLPVGGQPALRLPVSFSAACFVGAFITDIAYWKTLDVKWETFSVWLILAGLVLAAIAIIVFVVELIAGKRARTLVWPHIGYAVAVLLSLFNMLIHSRDAYTAVVPTGLTLSTLVVIILILSAWAGSALVDRQHIGANS